MDIKKEDLLKIKTFEDIVFLAIKPSFLDKLNAGDAKPETVIVKKRRGRPKKEEKEEIIKLVDDGTKGEDQTDNLIFE